jgi:hypothetical protein
MRPNLLGWPLGIPEAQQNPEQAERRPIRSDQARGAAMPFLAPLRPSFLHLVRADNLKTVLGCVGAINAQRSGLEVGLGALVREYSMTHSPSPPLYIEALSLSFGQHTRARALHFELHSKA